MTLDGLCSSCFSEIETYPCPFCGYDPELPTEKSDALPIGTTLREKYQVGRVINAGVGSICYAGIHLSSRAPILIQEYFPVSMAGRDADGVTVLQLPSAKQAFLAGVGSFLREARTLRALRSISCLNASTADFLENRTVYALYPFPEGSTLAEFVRKHGALSYSEALQLFTPIFQAIRACHMREALHLAVRPDAIWITDAGRPQLTGFSAAEYAVSPSPEQTMRSPYSPPEFLEEPGRVGPWTDVYGAAASFYFALTGLAPGLTPLPLCDCAVRLPLAASDLIQRILTERSPEARVSDMDALITGLKEAEEKTPRSDEKLPVWNPTPTSAERTPPPTAEEPHDNPQETAPEAESFPLSPAEQPAFAENRTDPVTCRKRKRKKQAFFFWITLLCLAVAAAAVGLTFFLPKPNAARTAESSAELVSFEHRWLGIRLEAPSDFHTQETEKTLCLSSDEGLEIRFDFSVFCGVALYGPEDIYENLAAFADGYGALTGLSELNFDAPEWVMLTVDEALCVRGTCNRAGELAECTLYAIQTENEAGCLLISIVQRNDAPMLREQAEQVVQSLELTGKTGSSIRVAENSHLGIRFMYDASLLKSASEPDDEEVRLYLRTAPSQSVCLCAPLPQAQTTLAAYCSEQLANVRKSLGNRLKQEESRHTVGKLGNWEGAEFRYDVYEDAWSVREEMYADRNGKLLNLYFYAGQDTADALRQAAELIMQSAEQLP